MKKIKPLLLLFTLLLTLTSFGQDNSGCIPQKPSTPKLVNDFANILSPSDNSQLESRLEQFARNTSNQIVLVTVDSICGEGKAMMANQIGAEWGVGDKNFNNGIVILIKPKQKNSSGQAFIAVGDGLQGALPDAIAKEIVEYQMIPYFKKGDYAGGLNSAVSIISKIAKGEYSAKQYAKAHSHKRFPVFPIIFIIIFIVGGMIFNVKRARSYAVGHNTSFWTALFLMSSMNSGGGFFGGGGNSGFGSSGGGFGGGGFGGFGGGGFSGGGAGGSW